MATLIVGLAFAGLLAWSFSRFKKSLKQPGCPGCSGGCTDRNRSCH